MARPIIGAETVLASPPKCKSYKRLHLGVEINQLVSVNGIERGIFAIS